MSVCPKCKKNISCFAFCPYCGYGFEEVKRKREKRIRIVLNLPESLYEKLLLKLGPREKLKENLEAFLSKFTD